MAATCWIHRSLAGANPAAIADFFFSVVIMLCMRSM